MRTSSDELMWRQGRVITARGLSNGACSTATAARLTGKLPVGSVRGTGVGADHPSTRLPS